MKIPWNILFNLTLIVVGCFLPWLHSALFVVRLRGVEMVDGKVVLGLAAAGFLWMLYQILLGKKASLPNEEPAPSSRPFFYGVIGLAVVAVTGLDLALFYQKGYPIGPGIYLACLGGAQLVVYFFKKPAKKREVAS
jgi:hypothetical protein